MANLAPLSKKTKQELIEEFGKLTDKLDELKATSSFVHKQENLDFTARAGEHGSEAISASITDARKKIAGNLEELAKSLNESLAFLNERIEAEAKKFAELRQAIELSKKELEVNYNIRIAAETIGELVAEHADKKESAEKDFEKRKAGIELEIAETRRAWEREKEEYGYALKQKREREELAYSEERAKQVKGLEDREAEIKQQEDEIAQVKKLSEDLPETIRLEVEKKEKEILKRFEGEFAFKSESLKKDWELERRLAEMKNKNLEEQLKKQDFEMTMLKKEAEASNKKAQELAVRIVEAGARAKSPAETGVAAV
jgi:hypothetical protein